MLGILKFSKHYTLPNDAVENMSKVMNAFFDKPVVPETRYGIDKTFHSNDVEYHAVCEKCEVYLKQLDRKERTAFREVCKENVPLKGTNANFFVVLNAKDRIKNLLESNDEYYNGTVSNRKRQEGVMTDINDGVLYKQFMESLPPVQKDSYATCVFNSDGSPVLKSSTLSVWPIQIIVNESPVNIRTSKAITFGLWFGRNKPKMNLFLKPFVDKMNDMSTQGIPCKIKTKIRNIKVQ